MSTFATFGRAENCNLCLAKDFIKAHGHLDFEFAYTQQSLNTRQKMAADEL
jgi:hypothetical protein